MEARSSFSVEPDAYASNRPTYPAALYSWIASCCAANKRAWDCGTGNGQAAMGLANHFLSIEATDISDEQVRQGFHAPNVRYSVQQAERTQFRDASFDLVAVAQALHWFDYDPFWREVRRVARPGAFFCAWGYSWFEAEAGPEGPFVEQILDVLAPYWAPNNRVLWEGYKSEDIRFPFTRVEAPAFEIEVRWDIAQLLGYIRTWSAYKRARADGQSAGVISELEEHATGLLQDRGAMTIRTPITIAGGVIS